jgi:hypothetical protein
MTKIVLTPEQANLYHQATEPVQVCDVQGIVLGTLPPDYSAEFIAELKRRARMPGRTFTGEQVRRHLQALDEAWQRDGPFDLKRAMELLEQFRAEDSK